MAKGKKATKSTSAKRPERVKLTAEESLKRMKAFDDRKEQIVAAVRKGKNRSVPA